MLRKHLISKGYDALFNCETSQGKHLYELAADKNSLITKALNGSLSLVTDVKRQDVDKDLSFEDKVAGLSHVEYCRLVMLARVNVSSLIRQQEHCVSECAREVLPARAENRHTVFRHALAVFKRKQRSKILMERAKMTRDGRS